MDIDSAVLETATSLVITYGINLATAAAILIIGWLVANWEHRNLRKVMDGETLVGTSTVAYAYRRHPGNATAAQSESFLRFDEESALFDEVAARADRLGWSEAARVARRKRIIRLHLAYRALSELGRLRVRAALDCVRYRRRLAAGTAATR